MILKTEGARGKSLAHKEAQQFFFCLSWHLTKLQHFFMSIPSVLSKSIDIKMNVYRDIRIL
jgi:hypothetical protein